MIRRSAPRFHEGRGRGAQHNNSIVDHSFNSFQPTRLIDGCCYPHRNSIFWGGEIRMKVIQEMLSSWGRVSINFLSVLHADIYIYPTACLYAGS